MGNQTDKSVVESTVDRVVSWFHERRDAQAREEAERMKRADMRQASSTLSVSETLRDLKEGVSALFTTWGSGRTYLQEYNLRSGRFEQSWKDNVSAKFGYENFSFRMATGWELPKGTLYNGKLAPKKDGKKIEAMDAVFFRRKDGVVEVLDHHDPRYTDLVVPYLVMQLAVPSAFGKAFGALSVATKMGKASEAARTFSNVSGHVWNALDNGSSLYQAGAQVTNNFILKPESIKKLSRLLDDPKNMDEGRLRDELNTVFSEYSYKGGPLSEQYFIPPLQSGENPVPRLLDVSRGAMHGIYKTSTPFEAPGAKHFVQEQDLSEVTKEVSENPYFQRGVLKLAIRSLSGEKLSANEKTLLQFGVNTLTQWPHDEKALTNLPDVLGDFYDISRSKGMSGADYASKLKERMEIDLKRAEGIIAKKEGTIQQQRMENAFTLG